MRHSLQTWPPSTALLLFAALIGLTLLSPAIPASAQAQGRQELPPKLEQRAHALYKQVMCPICDGQTIDQSRSQLASDMRTIIRERLLAGDTDGEILAFFVDAYGDSVLASPAPQGIGLAAWLVPPLGLTLGAGAVYLAIRTLRRPASMPTESDPASLGTSDDQLDTYLQLVDRELDDRQAAAPRRLESET